MDWEASTAERSFCATCYGASKVVFQEDVASSYSQEEVLRKAYTAKALGRYFDGLKITDMADKGAPNILRYQSSQQEEGYLFILIVNDQKDATYEESMKYPVFEGLTLLPPESGSDYAI